MHDKSAQSLMDVLIRLMPELRSVRKNHTDPKLANMLYNKIWSSVEHKVADKKFRRPSDLKMADVERLKAEGLVEVSGDTIEITAKGTHVVKSMILGDDRSIFEEDGKPTDYLTATANLKPSRLKKSAKRASADPVEYEARCPKCRSKMNRIGQGNGMLATRHAWQCQNRQCNHVVPEEEAGMPEDHRLKQNPQGGNWYTGMKDKMASADCATCCRRKA